MAGGPQKHNVFISGMGFPATCNFPGNQELDSRNEYIVFLWAAGHSAQAPGTHKAEKEDRDDLARSAKSPHNYLISHARLRGGSGIN